MKGTTQKKKSPIIHLPKYFDKSLCIVHTLTEYVSRTEKLRKNEAKLFISFCKPYRAVSGETISRWIKKVMFEAGLDIELFKPHSTRAAAASAASDSGLDIQTIMDAVGWSNANIFAKFYKKPIETGLEFGQRILGA